MIKHVNVWWVLVPILSTFYQLCVKFAAEKMGVVPFGLPWLSLAIKEPWIWATIASEIVAFLVWMKILEKNNLSKAFPLSAACYFLVLLMSWVVFGEKILPLQIGGSALILLGIWMIGTADPSLDDN